jgi:hypothetical protein
VSGLFPSSEPQAKPNTRTSGNVRLKDMLYLGVRRKRRPAQERARKTSVNLEAWRDVWGRVVFKVVDPSLRRIRNLLTA